MISIKTYLLIFILFCVQISNFAQNSSSVKIFTVEDGISSNGVNCVFLDSNGYLWIGTNDGLNRYDGYEFRHYRNDPLDTNTIVNSFITSIAEGKNNELWLGTPKGISILSTNSNAILRLHKDDDYSKNGFNFVFKLKSDKKGNIWVLYRDRLEKINQISKISVVYELKTDIFSVASGNNLFDLEFDYNGVWIATKDGLQYVDFKSGLLLQYLSETNNDKSLSDNEIRAILKDKNGSVWVGTSSGLNKFNYRKKEFEKFNFSQVDIRANVINDIFEDKNLNKWLATDAGLFKFVEEKGTITPILDNFNTLGYLSRPVQIIQDSSSVFWVATGQGLMKINKFDTKISLVNSILVNNQILPNVNFKSIYTIQGKIIIGTLYSGLIVMDTNTHKNTLFNNRNSELSDNSIHSITKDSANDFWLGTSKGVFVLDSDCSKIEKRNEGEPSLFQKLQQQYINHIFVDSSNIIWISTNRGLFRIFNGKITEYKHKHNDANSLCSDIVFTTCEDISGNMWIGTIDGLDKLNVEKMQFIHYKKTINDQNSLLNNTIISLYKDSYNHIWVGTSAGLNKYNRQKNHFEIINNNDVTGFSYIYGIAEDNHKNLWISSNSNVIKLNLRKYTIKVFDAYDGISASHLNIGCIFYSKSGEIFLGGENGLSIFNPDSVKENLTQPRIKFTKVERIGKEQQFFEYLISDTIFINYNDLITKIYFSSLEFTRPEKNIYKYFLEGYQESWLSVGNQNYAQFSQLPEGIYTLYVKGSNSDKIFNEIPAKITIVVSPHFLYSKRAYLAYIFLLVVIIFSIVLVRHRIRKRSIVMLKEKEKANTEIARQKEELSIKNTNITDSINYAKRILDAMMPTTKALNKYISQSFILYLPKDIVSGDFFWISEKNGKVFIAVVDCTGHGIPGAFMSIIGLELLRNILYEQGEERPDRILQDLHEGVIKTFGEDNDGLIKDGMDISFCVVDKNRRVMEYAGAIHPLYLVRDNNIFEIDGDRVSLGMKLQGEFQFKKHEIELEESDVVYIFSDGYTDQFGGPQGKKYKHRRFRHLILSIYKLNFTRQFNVFQNTFEQWKGEMEQVDDILVIGFKPLSDM